MVSGEYDDYDVLIQVDGQSASMSMLHADEKLKCVWWAGNSSLGMPEVFNKTPITQKMFDSAKEHTQHIIEQLDYRDKHGHWPK